MEFNEKLQELRKKRGLTQEELAEALYVSRTAISKWESGRGYPNIDSLKAIAAFFSVTIDELLSSGEALTIAEEDSRQNELRLRRLVFALLDIGTVIFFFLPFFGENAGGSVSGVSLLALSSVQPYLKAIFLCTIFAIIIFGILTLALQGFGKSLKGHESTISLILNALAAFLFIISRQPYAAAFLFIFLAVKVAMLIKKQ